MICFPAFRAAGSCTRVALLASVISIAACSSTLEPPDASLHLSVSAAVAENSPVPPATVVAVAAGSVQATGYITTATPCYGISASHRIAADTLVVALKATSSASACAQVLATFKFVAVATGVPSTVTHVRVEQTGAVSGFAAVLADQPVSLP
jgi:hypothetical protein